MTFSIRILGSSSALPTSHRFSPAHLLNANEHFFLIDCGEGTQIQLRRYRVNLSKLNHIFISHIHGDHVFGIFGLLSSFSLLGKETPVHIYGPDLLEDMLLDHLKYFQSELSFELMIHKINCRRSAIIYQNEQIEVRSIPLTHRVPTCGFLFTEKTQDRNIRKEMVERYQIPVKEIARIKNGSHHTTGDGTVIPNTTLTLPPFQQRSYAYCSDTEFSESLVSYVRNVDILFHESTFADEDRKLAKTTGHSTTTQAAEIAKSAGAGKLLIGHFSSRYKDVQVLEKQARTIFPETIAVNDGDLFEIEQVRMPENS